MKRCFVCVCVCVCVYVLTNGEETKNQWARDDPAFLLVQALFVSVCCVAYALAFRHSSVWSYLWTVLYGVFVDWLLVGFAVASTCRCGV